LETRALRRKPALRGSVPDPDPCVVKSCFTMAHIAFAQRERVPGPFEPDTPSSTVLSYPLCGQSGQQSAIACAAAGTAAKAPALADSIRTAASSFLM